MDMLIRIYNSIKPNKLINQLNQYIDLKIKLANLEIIG